MKKLIIGFLTAIALFSVPVAALADSGRNHVQTVTISGVIRSNGRDVRSADVTVSCGNRTVATRTDRRGDYSVSFRSRQCQTGSTVVVSANKGSQGGENDGRVNRHDSARVDVSLVNVALPELGTLTGIGSALFAGVAFMLVRRRTLGSNTQE